jgi:hypothetical protein
LQLPAAGLTTLKSKLARSGHAAHLSGTRVIITGGILREGSKLVDIIVVDLATLSIFRCGWPCMVQTCALALGQQCLISPGNRPWNCHFCIDAGFHHWESLFRVRSSMSCRPEAGGAVPSTRFRHTMTPIKASPGTALADQLSEALGPFENLCAGELLLCFGGYNTVGEEFGADSTYVRPYPAHVFCATWCLGWCHGYRF